MARAVQGALLSSGATAVFTPVLAADATDDGRKLLNLPDDKLAEIVTKDITERQFLVTGDITRSIYSEDCTFKDEIDTYTIDKWVKGTKALFVGDKSRVALEGPVVAKDGEVRFRFDEVLCFNIPLQPKVPLKGTLVLRRGNDGLINSYQEIWDTSVLATISKAYL